MATADNPTPYANLVIYCFSGTGNALAASRWIEGHGRARGLTTYLVNIDNPSEVPALQGRTLVGFCFPTHGFAAPWIMLKFFFAFRRFPGADMFFLNTRAGFRLGPLHAGPGVSGVAMWLPIFWFALRGYRIVGSLPLDMPHSWISFFWPNTRQGIELIRARCERIVKTYSDAMLAGRRYFRWSIWLTLPLDLSLIWVTVLYVFVGRFYLAKTLFAAASCNDCRLCADTCPIGAIEMRGARPFWKYTCESCMRCMNICPSRSIQSWVTRIVLLSWLFMAAGMVIWSSDTFWFLLASVLFFPAYRLLHRLWGNKVVNAAFTYSSLTRAWHRYLAPGIKAKDFRAKSAGQP